MAEENKPSGGEPLKPEDVQAALARVKELEGELDTARGKAKKFSDEAAAARVARKQEYEDRIATLEAQLSGKGKDGDGTPTPKPSDAEAAQLRSEIASLKKRDEERDTREKQREARVKEQSHRARVAELVAKHKLENPEDATELLMRRTKLADDESTLLYTAKDKDTGAPNDLALTDENFEGAKLLGATFWPAKGVPGAGGKSPKPLSGAGDVVSRGLSSQEEFNKNFPKIKEAMRGGT